MPTGITETGVVGILVLLILREVFAYIRSRRNNIPCMAHDILQKQVADMWGVVRREDSEGVKLVYTRNKALEDAIGVLAMNTTEQTKLIRVLVDEVKTLDRDVKAHGVAIEKKCD